LVFKNQTEKFPIRLASLEYQLEKFSLLGMPKRMLIKIVKKKRGQGSEWFAIFHGLSRILFGYVFVGASCGWGWT
jgi:hypothetical protein